MWITSTRAPGLGTSHLEFSKGTERSDSCASTTSTILISSRKLRLHDNRLRLVGDDVRNVVRFTKSANRLFMKAAIHAHVGRRAGTAHTQTRSKAEYREWMAEASFCRRVSKNRSCWMLALGAALIGPDRAVDQAQDPGTMSTIRNGARPTAAQIRIRPKGLAN